MTPFFEIDKRIQSASEKAIEQCKTVFSEIDERTEYNQLKVLKSFITNQVSERHFAESTGYGYNDDGRDKLDAVFADIYGAEDAIVRHSFASGTHTLSVALFGVLRPGDTMLCVTGTPYDTIHDVIGISGKGMGSLKECGVQYSQVELDANGRLDFVTIERTVALNLPTMVYLQRSRGYALRPSLSVEEIGAVSDLVKRVSPNSIVMVDNCYGEMVQVSEPTQHGVDLIAGSLIKNAGGGIAKSGGYIAGRKDLVAQCAYRFTAPGVGREIGASLGHNRELFLGLFHAPHVVGEALKTAAYISAFFASFGYDVLPKFDEQRCDIIQCLGLENPESLIAFCQGIQSGSPIDAFVVPEPWDMPGYESKVVMAAGAFTSGSSIELSADAPMRAPYYAWIQGGLNFHSGKLCANLAAQQMLQKGLLK